MEVKKYWGVGWMIAFLGFPPGGLLAAVLIGKLDTAPEGIVGGAAAGIIIGAAQTLALRRRLPVGPEWIAATTLGLAAGISLNVALFGADNQPQRDSDACAADWSSAGYRPMVGAA